MNVKISNEGVHSGDASGIIPDTFRILRIVMIITLKKHLIFVSFLIDWRILSQVRCIKIFMWKFHLSDTSKLRFIL